ncbi:hypothetical protein A7981_06960 [Methylovorus sp. MM2]|uniref:WbqC family protein n=1 Tax=Methylovorus sp. MM2 TaxID=1848038 RepID=UPI0007DFE05B|nr:WbqC family protein [Methylovorus sp. MM2]OAM53145.1 hypothetical protein A7981_06960 [Methylovorus sp. MM2]
MTTIAIMQPTFLPWIGYFDLIDQVDYFVYLDTVEFSKQSWQQRNRVKSSQGPVWISLPVTYSKTLKTTIKDAEVGNLGVFHKSINTIKHSYAKARFANEHLQWIIDWLARIQQGESLADINIDFIEKICQKLLIDTPRVRGHDVPHNPTRHGRLIDICKHFNVDRYISPMGAYSYLTEDASYFEEAGIEIVFHTYNHPVYRQLHGDFTSYLSMMDLLLNEGDDSLDIIRTGRLAPRKFSEMAASI